MALNKQKEASFKLKVSPGFLACRGFVGWGEVGSRAEGCEVHAV